MAKKIKSKVYKVWVEIEEQTIYEDGSDEHTSLSDECMKVCEAPGLLTAQQVRDTIIEEFGGDN